MNGFDNTWTVEPIVEIPVVVNGVVANLLIVRDTKDGVIWSRIQTEDGAVSWAKLENTQWRRLFSSQAVATCSDLRSVLH